MAFLPQTALGMSLDGLPTQLLALPFAPFVTGILGGIAVGAGVYGLAARLFGAPVAPQPAQAPGSPRPAHAAHAAEAPVAASLYKPRHMSVQDFEKSGMIRVLSAQACAAPAAPAEPAEPSAKPAEPVQPAKQRPASPRHFKAAIMERFGASMMEGVPVIQRADGSVGDVGTSWWVHGVGEKTIISDSGFADERPVDAFLHDENRLTPQAITHRVAQIDEGLYPEKRTSDDLDKPDAWESALEALDETLGEPKEPFYASAELVAGAGRLDAVDESDGPAADTGFIPFRVPAGHPEVVDTASYINHLIADEFSRSTSSSLRSSSRNHMRVIEGGTHNLKAREGAPASKTGAQAYVGKHFAPMAAQA